MQRETTNQPSDYDPFSSPHPVIDAAIEALTFGGQIPVAEIPRDRAARLLACWARNDQLTERERTAILARFPSPATMKE